MGPAEWGVILRDHMRAAHGYGDGLQLYVQELVEPQAIAALVHLGHARACRENADTPELRAWLAYLPHVSPAWDTVQVRTWKAELEAIGRAALATLPEDEQDAYLLAHDFRLWVSQVGTFPASPIRLGQDGPEAVRCDAHGFQVDRTLYPGVVAELQAVWQRRRALIEAGEFGPEFVRKWG